MKLRQVALVAENLATSRENFFHLLGVEDDFADEGLDFFGLNNSVMAIGETFLEIVSPKQQGTTAGRFLKQRNGDGGYMVLAQVNDIAPVRDRMDKLGIRKIWETERDDVLAFHVHPKDIGAAIVSFDEMRPSEDWLWAGPNWRERKAKYVSKISATTIQSVNPETIARRWAEAFAKSIEWVGDRFQLPLDEGLIEFVEASDGRGDGVAAVRFECAELNTLKSKAISLGLDWRDDEVVLNGTRLEFREV